MSTLLRMDYKTCNEVLTAEQSCFLRSLTCRCLQQHSRASPCLRRSAQDFEAELKKYNAVEQRISEVPAVRNIGALSLETQPLKAALRAEAASWKAQFARNLHKQSAEDLRVHQNLEILTR